MTKKTCPFCEPKDRILQENSLALVLLSNPRKVPGHFLVIPKRHVEKPWDLTTKEVTEIFTLIFTIQKKTVGKLGDGFQIRQNYMPYVDEGKVKVNHAHFHLMPRYHNDYLHQVAGRYEDDLFADLDPAEHDAVATLLQDSAD